MQPKKRSKKETGDVQPSDPLDHAPYAAYRQPKVRTDLWFKMIMVLAVMFMLGITLRAVGGNNSLVAAVGAVLYLGSMSAIFATIAFSRPKSKPRVATADRLLAELGWKRRTQTAIADVATQLLERGNRREILAGYDAVYRSRSGTAVQYRYAWQGQNDTDNEIIWFTSWCLKLQLSAAYPQIIVSRTVRTTAWNKNILPQVKHRQAVSLQLEGDFNDHFEATTLPGMQSAALAFLTPDFMSELEDSPYEFDFEIGGNELFVYAVGDFRMPTDAAVMHNMLGGADLVFKHVDEIQESWNKASTKAEIAAMRDDAVSARQGVLAQYTPEDEGGMWDVYGVGGKLPDDDSSV